MPASTAVSPCAGWRAAVNPLHLRRASWFSFDGRGSWWWSFPGVVAACLESRSARGGRPHATSCRGRPLAGIHARETPARVARFGTPLRHTGERPPPRPATFGRCSRRSARERPSESVTASARRSERLTERATARGRRRESPKGRGSGGCSRPGVSEGLARDRTARGGSRGHGWPREDPEPGWRVGPTPCARRGLGDEARPHRDESTHPRHGRRRNAKASSRCDSRR